jgi:N-acetyl-gamma-glutamyl-phosphate reductase
MDLVAVSTSHAGHPCTAAHPDLHGILDLTFVPSINDASSTPAVIFLCLGHGASAPWMAANHVPASAVVIDLGNDHRLDPAWVYGLPERFREQTVDASRIANPGCFATCIELALLPLSLHHAIEGPVHTTAITGSTGAGQQPSDTTHYSWRANNLSVYKAFEHQHLPEIRRAVAQDVVLIPMRGPFTRGIMASTVVRTSATEQTLRSWYAEAYATHPFTHVVDDLPDLKRVVNTNMCQIGLQMHGEHLLIVSVIDNLVKGASGQAIQNMNLALGLPETMGLHCKPSVY